MSQSNSPLSEEDRRALTNSQLLQLAREHGIVLSAAEQSRLTNSQLIDLAQLGQRLTPSSRNQLTSEQKLRLHSIVQELASQLRETNQKPIFVSHASDDKALVEKFVDLLVDGIGVNRDDIFCTSLEEHGVPAGEDFVSYIKSQIQSPQLVLMVITPTYYERKFCLCEMGACWALSLKGIPLIVDPISYSDLDGVISDIQAIKMSDKNRMTELRDAIVSELSLEGRYSSVWERKRDDFIAWLSSNLIPTQSQASEFETPIDQDEVGTNPAIGLALRIDKVIQFAERKLADGGYFSQGERVRLFQKTHLHLSTIYAEAPDRLRSSLFREALKSVEETYLSYAFDKPRDTRRKGDHALKLLKEFHDFLMVGI